MITEYLKNKLPELLAEREQKGIETYGHTLTTWNGRDAGKDAIEELLDAFQYVTQMRMEFQDLRNAARRYLLYNSESSRKSLIDLVEKAYVGIDFS